MSLNKLTANISREKLIRDISNNLGINFITDGSNLGKLIDSYYNEIVEFSSLIESALSEGFLKDMPEDLLDLFGKQYGVVRKRYNMIDILKTQNVISLEVDKTKSNITSINSPILLFNRGDLIYSNGNFLIFSKEDIYLNDINQVQYISIKINLTPTNENFSIVEDTVLSSNKVDESSFRIIPEVLIRFRRSVGLSVIEEPIEDYKARIVEATYIANNGANTLLSSLLKEVPLVYYIESENYVDGKGVKAIYPYTDELINNGSDNRIDNYIIPMLEANLHSKVIYGQLIDVIPPSSLNVKLILDFSSKSYSERPTQSYLNNLKLKFNQYFYRTKIIDKESLLNFITPFLSNFNLETKDFYFVFTSPHISEESFNIDSLENESINLPTGKFLNMISIFINELPNFLVE